MKKSIKRVISLLLCVVYITMGFASPVYAATVTTSGYTTIKPTNAQFESSKSPKYYAVSETISGKIGSKYKMDITHYEAPKEGYYSIYTTGSTDTVGAVFEQQNILWITTEYKEKGFDDDAGSGFNYKMVVDLDMFEDYYICTRGYSTKTGSYNLVIEPNLDRLTSSSGGKWINDHIDWSTVSFGGIETISKDYYTAEQVKLYYQILRDKDTRESIADAYSASGISGAVSKIYSIFKLVIGIIDFGKTGNTVVTGLLFAEGVFTTMMETIRSTKSPASLMKTLESVCGAGYKLSSGIDIYYASYGVCITNSVQTITNQSYSYTKYSDTYEKYTSKTLKGVKYEAGHWE